MAEASSSKLHTTSPVKAEHIPSPTDEGAISLHLPTSFLVLPPVAGLIGLGIGMSRGGSRARLRFLAENAHRPPTTYRGWVRPLSVMMRKLTGSTSTLKHVITESFSALYVQEGNTL